MKPFFTSNNFAENACGSLGSWLVQSMLLLYCSFLVLVVFPAFCFPLATTFWTVNTRQNRRVKNSILGIPSKILNFLHVFSAEKSLEWNYLVAETRNKYLIQNDECKRWRIGIKWRSQLQVYAKGGWEIKGFTIKSMHRLDIISYIQYCRL